MIYTNSKTNTKFIDISALPLNEDEKQFPVISLFSGAGGLDIGLENSGFQTAACIEYDIDCRETLKFNRPEWKVFEEKEKLENGKVSTRVPGDVRDISVDELLDFVGLVKGEVSLVVGGAPCQPFSNIGKKLGKNDERNGDLFLEFVRMVKGIQPEAFIFENVVGITQNKHSDVIAYMVDKLQGLGYGISHTILNAANYGVPQRRERFFLIGIKGVDKPAFPFPTHFKNLKHYESYVKDFQSFPLFDVAPLNNYKKWVSVDDAFKNLPLDTTTRKDYVLMNISDFVVNRMTYINQGENFKVLPMELRPNCWKNGRHQGNDTFGRLIADLPSVTIRTAAYNPAKGMYIHPWENRGLSTIEMAALQSFPYDWNFRVKGREKGTLVSVGKQIGNAVPPVLAQALGTAIMKQILAKHVKSEQMLPELVEEN
ncbi:DNA cytosine methyltransferase [Spirosoma fluviale]|uniref:Cytosine-specific methyltransferase n=1 Tax=Spirosoma fluviale TaxID=1597977 RepID=A0A286G9L9_9BACT|nr:DNA cytosine methyltransferase [Spirosoma fluviale]SOD91684.1 DNA (cytosine-5)-methyltransferase 1 [Spirosoma fluviale]